MSQELPPELRLRLPTDPEALRTLRHDLRTDINAILGYCELIEEEAGNAAPLALRAGIRELHAVGTQMLKLTNGVFSDRPSAWRELSIPELRREFHTSGGAAAALCTKLEQQADAAALPVAAQDMRRIGIATGRWLAQVKQLLAQNGE